MGYRAVIIDLDGTLLNKKHTITPFTLETLQKLHEKSIHIILATGRSHPDVLFRIEKWGLVGSYAISSNGARIHGPDRNVIHSQDLDESIVAELVRIKADSFIGADGIQNRPPVSTNLYRHDDWLTNCGVEVMLHAYSDSGYSYKEVDLLQCPYDGVHEVCYLGAPEELQCVEEVIKARLTGKVEYNHSARSFLDVVPLGVNKGDAMKQVADILGIELSETIAFGDAMNDYNMLKMAGKGYIMSNAIPMLKEQLPDMELIGTNDEDGVAKKLREVFSL